ncbi:alpha/beta hydrolase [Millisia brevis]|uniref:alpha/beta hydrolase n=1 Tax=Millisia brevis TaxID=264148 RepID=UPI000834559A|nr:alpha/beta hydrolase [Millisia brevis]
MTIQRLDVEFRSDGTTCRAWLYLPAGPPAPVIVMAHGLGATRGMRIDAHAERFAAAGYACLLFDYRYFGDSDGQPRQLLDIDSQLADWSAAVDYARTRPEVDGSRIVLWGTSFSGGHVITTAARRADVVTATIAQCPFTDGYASALAMDPRTSIKVGLRAARDIAGSLVGRPPVMVPLVGPLGSGALMTAPDAMPGYLALADDPTQVRNEVAARVGLRIPLRRPGRDTARVRCPILFYVCDPDSVAPDKATLRHAARAPHGEVITYPAGHFEIYVDPHFDKVITDQIDFLRRHVPVAGAR